MMADTSAGEEYGALGAAPELGFAAALAEQRVLAKLLGTAPAPLRVGDYELIEELGSGGMGTV